MNRSAPLIASALLLAGAVGLYAFLALQTARATAAFSAAEATEAGLGATALRAQGIAGFLRDTAAARAALASFVISDENVPALLSLIEDAAREEQVSASIGSVSVLSSPWSFHEPLEVKLSGRGSLSALASFSTDLESLPDASHLVAASFQAAADRSWFGTFTVDFVKERAPGSAATSSPSRTP